MPDGLETPFQKRVHRIVRNIPPGKTLNYGEVAKRAGAPGAARAVGTLLSKNYDPAIPCHRVIRSDGTYGEYNRGIKKKIRLLQKEQAHVTRLLRTNDPRRSRS